VDGIILYIFPFVKSFSRKIVKNTKFLEIV